MKRFLSVFGALVIIIESLSAAFCTGADAKEVLEKKAVYLNVAENKPVKTKTSYLESGFGAEKLTDGLKGSPLIVGMEAGDWIEVDLERRYFIDRLELTDRYDIDHEEMRKNIRITVSNKEDFSEYEVVGEIGNDAAENFTHKGLWSLSPDKHKAWRYIRIERTGGYAYGGFGEMRVFAECRVSGVKILSAHASDETSVLGYLYAAERAIDGLNGDPGDAWVAETTDKYHFLTLDLGEEKNIGYIELEDRFENSNRTSVQGYIIYGSQTTEDDSILINNKDLSGYEEYKRLARIPHFGEITEDEQFPFPQYPGGAYKAAVSNNEPLRYITLKKDYFPLAAMIGEARAFEICPDVIGVYIDKSGAAGYERAVCISFSDEMDTSSAEGFYFPGNGGIIKAEGKWIDGYTFCANAEELSDDICWSVQVNSTVKNKYGTALFETYTENDVLSENISVLKSELKNENGVLNPNVWECSALNAEAEIRNPFADEKKACLFLAVYDKNGRLINAVQNEFKVCGGGKKTVKAAFDLTPFKASLAEGDYAKILIWDKDLKPASVQNHEESEISDIYVSKNGNDLNNGSKKAPVATLKMAKQLVHAINSDMSGDINVHIEKGVYVQNETLCFTQEDSGTNGYFVNYIGENGTVISGGEKINGFEKIREDGLYCADYDAESVRELYVNGRKAERARSEKKIKPISLYEENGKKKGFKISSEDIGLYENPGDIQICYDRSWRTLLLNAENIISSDDGSFILTLKQPEFEYATAENGAGYAFWVDGETSFYLENAPELLDRENEFYYDRTNKKLYYKSETVDMSNAEVYAPKLEKILEVKGNSLDKKAENITFKGITFEAGAYKKADEGYLGDQAQRFETLGNLESGYSLDETVKGANIRVSAAKNIKFENNVFRGMGAVALGFYNGAEQCSAEGNVFYDINDSAVTVGLPDDAYMQTKPEKGCEIALNKPTASTGWKKYYYSGYANDGFDTTGWTAVPPEGGNYLDAYWQVDLQDLYEIDLVKIKPRKGYDQEITRKNFEILASNTPDFGSYVVLATCGENAYSNENGFESEVFESGKYRYVRIRKTKNEYFYISDVELYTYEKEFVPVKEVCKDIVLSNNYITGIGLFNHGAPGIQTYYTDGVQIKNNLIKNVPYSGIAMGWGWSSTKNSVTSRNNKITDNIVDTFNMINFDGGGIYTLGQQPGSEICGNYVKNQINGHAGYYPDSGSSQYSVKNNVFEDVDIPFFVYGSDQSYLTIKNNYANNNSAKYLNKAENSDIEKQIYYFSGAEHQEVMNIKNNAGLTEKYKDIVNNVPENYEGNKVSYENAAEENRWNIGALQDPKFLEFYLEHLLNYSKDILSYADEQNISGEKTENLRSCVLQAETVYNNAKSEITIPKYDKETKLYDDKNGHTMNREAVISARISLKNALKNFAD